jgi:hypothetical protein
MNALESLIEYTNLYMPQHDKEYADRCNEARVEQDQLRTVAPEVITNLMAEKTRAIQFIRRLARTREAVGFQGHIIVNECKRFLESYDKKERKI